jgi:hypothetical protein
MAMGPMVVIVIVALLVGVVIRLACTLLDPDPGGWTPMSPRVSALPQ